MEFDTAGPNFKEIELTVDIVAAYVSNNQLSSADLRTAIAIVHSAITGIATGNNTDDSVAKKLTLAQIRESVRHDALVSFINGKPYKTLKRHLANHGHTPDTYRAQFGLPMDYPTTAPSYSKRRSALAKSVGLGIKHRRKQFTNDGELQPKSQHRGA